MNHLVRPLPSPPGARVRVFSVWLLGLSLLGSGFSMNAAENVSKELDPIRESHSLPALSAAMMRKGELIAIGACGIRKVGSPESVTIDDRWHLGSCTKSMTASLAAMLIENSQLHWNTTVGESFPGWEMAPAWKNVTLAQLLTHRSGAPANPPAALWQEAWLRLGSPPAQRIAFVQGLLKLPPESSPGSQFTYSNQGYAIAGTLLEKVTGEAWESLLQNRLFNPLQLQSAGFGTPATRAQIDQPWGHRKLKNRLEPIDPGPEADNPPAIGPAGTVHMSIGDFARYASWHARPDASPLLNSASFRHLHRPAAGGDYAAGWITLQRSWAGGDCLTHNGSNGSFYAVMWVAPEIQTALVATTNFGGPEAQLACDAAISLLIQRFLSQ